MKELPIACTLSPADLQRQRDGLLPALVARADAHEVIADGVRLRFAASTETLQTIARVIDAERQCCQFFRFQLTIEPGLGPIVLDVQGPAGTAEFLADLIASAASATSPHQSSSK